MDGLTYYLGGIIQFISFNRFWVYPRLDTSIPVGAYTRSIRESYYMIDKWMKEKREE